MANARANRRSNNVTRTRLPTRASSRCRFRSASVCPGNTTSKGRRWCPESRAFRIRYSKARDRVEVHLEAHGLPYRPSLAKTTDDSTPFNKQPAAVESARWRLWLAGSLFGRQHEDLYYATTYATGRKDSKPFLGTRYDMQPNGPKPPPSPGYYYLSQGSARQMLGSPLFEPSPAGDVDFTFTLPYHRMADADGTPGGLNVLLPFDECLPDAIANYWTESRLPDDKFMSWDSFLTSIWSGDGIEVMVTAEPESKGGQLPLRESTFVGWANVYPAVVPSGFGLDFCTFGTILPIRGESHQLALWPQTSRRRPAPPGTMVDFRALRRVAVPAVAAAIAAYAYRTDTRAAESIAAHASPTHERALVETLALEPRTDTASAAAPEPKAGEPLGGLSPRLRALFADGKERFLHQWTPEEGLGPLYNEKSCQTCHGGVDGIPGGPDALGRGSIHNVNHIGFDNEGFFDSMREIGGSLLVRQSIANDGIRDCDMHGQTVPATATILSVRNTPGVLGFGLIDAIPDAEILARQNLGVDGIRGVANWGIEPQMLDDVPMPQNPQVPLLGPPRVGRFGWKAQTATLQQFSAEPLTVELGISTAFFPQEHTDHGLRFVSHLPNRCNVAVPPECRGATHGPRACFAVDPDDADGKVAIQIYNFQALLAPPPRRPASPDAAWGREVFDGLGCGQCHAPAARTGREYHMRLPDGTTVRVPELEDQTFYPYSDFLLHDMGPALADNHSATVGRVQGRARGNQWRTTPLWGLSLKATYLHDGRTTDLRAAILAHDGEAAMVRGRYAALDPGAQASLAEFLMSL